MTFRRLVRGLGRRVPRRPFRYLMPAWLVRGPYRFWLSVVAADPDRRRAVRELLELEAETRRQLDAVAIRYDDGVHAKHRLTAYHDFFVERVREGERVLDVGSGKGELAHDLAVRAGAVVVGIDYGTSASPTSPATCSRPPPRAASTSSSSPTCSSTSPTASGC